MFSSINAYAPPTDNGKRSLLDNSLENVVWFVWVYMCCCQKCQITSNDKPPYDHPIHREKSNNRDKIVLVAEWSDNKA